MKFESKDCVLRKTFIAEVTLEGKFSWNPCVRYFLDIFGYFL